MNDVVIAYVCDRKACTNCTAPECMHTLDICHAANFEAHSTGTRNYFSEKMHDDTLVSTLLTPNAIEFINRYPIIINDLVARYEESMDFAIHQAKEY